MGKLKIKREQNSAFTWDSVWYKGWYYTRYIPKHGDPPVLFRISSDTEPKKGHDKNPPEVLCLCGNTHFELRYGCYELIAICVNCGRKDCVYSG